MRVSGVAIAGSVAVFVVLDIEGDTLNVVDVGRQTKIELGDHKDAESVRSFARAVDAFLADFKVDVVNVRGCSYNGMRSAGPAAIKAEGLIQALERQVFLYAPASTTVRLKKSNGGITDVFAYQQDALGAALMSVKL